MLRLHHKSQKYHARLFHQNGFRILATGGTFDMISRAGIPAEKVKKLYEGRPNILDLATNGEIQLIINTPIGKDSAHDDSYLRKSAVKNKMPYITTIAAARAAAEGIHRIIRHDRGSVRSLQEWHRLIREKA